MGRASGSSNTPYWMRNNILDFLSAISVKIRENSGRNGEICHKTTLGETL